MTDDTVISVVLPDNFVTIYRNRSSNIIEHDCPTMFSSVFGDSNQKWKFCLKDLTYSEKTGRDSYYSISSNLMVCDFKCYDPENEQMEIHKHNQIKLQTFHANCESEKIEFYPLTWYQMNTKNVPFSFAFDIAPIFLLNNDRKTEYGTLKVRLTFLFKKM